MTNPIFDGRIPPELLAEIERRIHENGVSASLPSVPPNTRYQWIERSINDGTVERERSIPAGMPSGLHLVLDNEFLDYVIQRGRRIHPDIENANLASTPTQPSLRLLIEGQLQWRLGSHITARVLPQTTFTPDDTLINVVASIRYFLCGRERPQQILTQISTSSLMASGMSRRVFDECADFILSFVDHELLHRTTQEETRSQIGIGNTDCAFNAKSLYIRCAVNPSGPCESCLHFETSASSLTC
jgi:hypothetical protein